MTISNISCARLIDLQRILNYTDEDIQNIWVAEINVLLGGFSQIVKIEDHFTVADQRLPFYLKFVRHPPSNFYLSFNDKEKQALDRSASEPIPWLQIRN